jgi:Zn-dependent peptidase ImmA (M78 family)
MGLTFRDSFCRKAANDVLDELMVGAPEEIDLETLAWIGGRRLKIIEGPLVGAEGRLVASENGGVIRIRSGIVSAARKRFTIAHEIGHRVLHGLGAMTDTLRNLRTWTKGSKETEANVFASELLMPERLFKPMVAKQSPSLDFIDRLADVFRTSRQAAAIRFIQTTAEPCAFIMYRHGKCEWILKSDSFEFLIRDGKPHKYTGVSELLGGKTGIAGPAQTPAGAWLQDQDPEGRASLMEDARVLPEYDEAVALLWLNEELD